MSNDTMASTALRTKVLTCAMSHLPIRLGCVSAIWAGLALPNQGLVDLTLVALAWLQMSLMFHWTWQNLWY